MHDHMYRMGVAWQNVAYNQPPHLGYYLPDYIESFRGISANAIRGIASNDDSSQVVGETFYRLDGTIFEGKMLPKGIYIKRTQYADNHHSVKKILIR